MAKRLTPRSGVCSSAQGPYVDFTETPPMRGGRVLRVTFLWERYTCTSSIFCWDSSNRLIRRPALQEASASSECDMTTSLGAHFFVCTTSHFSSDLSDIFPGLLPVGVI